MSVYRIHIRPGGGSADMKTIFQYCLDNGLLGAGYRVHDGAIIRTEDWDEFYMKASQIHDNLNTCKYIQKWVTEGDLVWTRDPAGQYFLARVTSGWEYWTSQEGINQDIDIANIFRCDIREVELDAVPGKIIACFRAPRTIQEIADGPAIAYSKHLWNELSGRQVYEVLKSDYSDIFMLLDDEETEDLVFIYLQSKGWYVVPNSRKADTMSFEYFLIHPSSYKRAWVQVKTGNSCLNRDDYSDSKHKIFLFQSNEYYKGTSSKNVLCITRNELLDFMKENKALLPGSSQKKLDMLEC